MSLQIPKNQSNSSEIESDSRIPVLPVDLKENYHLFLRVCLSQAEWTIKIISLGIFVYAY